MSFLWETDPARSPATPVARPVRWQGLPVLYDLVRRRFGRLGGFVAGLALASTPIAVAISRHNNPDALLMLCCVAAVWCAVRGLEGGRTRWVVLAGVFVGLGFETKMGVALTVVPGIV